MTSPEPATTDPWDDPDPFAPVPYVPVPHVTQTVVPAVHLHAAVLTDREAGLVVVLNIGDGLSLHFTGGGGTDADVFRNIDHLADALAALRVKVLEHLTAPALEAVPA